MRTMKTIKRLFKNKKGIDTILAALLMVVIVVVASVMVYAWSTGLLGGLLVTPQTGKESIGSPPENVAFATNNTQAILYLRNIGSVSLVLTTYYVRDAANNQWSRTSWSNGPTINVNQVVPVVINISAPAVCSPNPCPNFAAFVAGNSYTVIVVTARNNSFQFTIVR